MQIYEYFPLYCCFCLIFLLVSLKLFIFTLKFSTNQ